ncbi:MAG: efflux RND transporter periplasmic adaptor subunit [Cyanobacteriota bacterium]
MKKLILAVLFSLISFNSFGENTNTEKKENKENKILKVKKDIFTSSIKMIGDIEAKKQIYIAPFFSSKVEQIQEEGKKVKKGEEILKLDSKEQEDKLAELDLDIGVSENDLLSLEKNSKSEVIKLDSNIKLANKEVELRKLELDKTLGGFTKEELKKLELSLSLADKSLKNAKEELKQKELLIAKGILKSKDLLEQKLILSQKEKDYNISKTEYDYKLKGYLDITKAISKLELKKAQKKLEIAQNNKKYRLLQTKEEKQKISTKIESLKNKIKQIKEIISYASIKAPVEGTIVYSKIWTPKGLDKVKVGDTVRKGRTFLSIADLDDVVIKTELDEQFIKKIKKNLECKITSNNIKNKVFIGKISQIGILAYEKQGKEFVDGESKVFEVAIDLVSKKTALRPGMSVDIEIILKTLKDQIIIPNEYIYKEGSNNFVFNEKGEKKYIKIGDSNETKSIISSGLTIDDSIIIEKNDK